MGRADKELKRINFSLGEWHINILKLACEHTGRTQTGTMRLLIERHADELARNHGVSFPPKPPRNEDWRHFKLETENGDDVG